MTQLFQKGKITFHLSFLCLVTKHKEIYEGEKSSHNIRVVNMFHLDICSGNFKSVVHT